MKKEGIIINKTPHDITILDDAGDVKVLYPPKGEPARVKQSTSRIGEISGVPISHSDFGDVYNLPEPTQGTYYIVSKMVAEALPEREDLIFPNELVRDEKGMIKGCNSLSPLKRWERKELLKEKEQNSNI